MATRLASDMRAKGALGSGKLKLAVLVSNFFGIFKASLIFGLFFQMSLKEAPFAMLHTVKKQKASTLKIAFHWIFVVKQPLNFPFFYQPCSGMVIGLVAPA